MSASFSVKKWDKHKFSQNPTSNFALLSEVLLPVLPHSFFSFAGLWNKLCFQHALQPEHTFQEVYSNLFSFSVCFFPLSNWSEIMLLCTKGENTVFWQRNRYFYEFLIFCSSRQELKSSSLLSENQLSSHCSVSHRMRCEEAEQNVIILPITLQMKKTQVALFASLYMLKTFLRWFISSKATEDSLKEWFCFFLPQQSPLSVASCPNTYTSQFWNALFSF